MNKSIIELIQNAYDHAKEKHPVFDHGNGLFFAVSVLTEEVGETAQALNDGDIKQAILELSQVAAVSVRFIELLRAYLD